MELVIPKLETNESQWTFFRKMILSFEKKRVNLTKSTWEYWKCGQGEKTLIFFHGALIGPEMWFYPVSMLQNEYSIIIPFIPQNLSSVNEVIEFYQKLTNQERIHHSTIIGYSYGGGLVQILVDFLPKKIDRVVLSHAGLLWGREKVPSQKLIKLLLKIVPLSILKKILKKKRIEEYPDSNWNQFHREYFSQLMENLKKKNLRDYFNGVTAFLADYNYIGREPEVISFDGQVILLGTEGDEDAFSAMEEFRTFFPNALEHVFTESGGHHFIFLHPERYTQELYISLKRTE